MADHLTTSTDTTGAPHKVLWGAPIAVILTFLLVGCYTILKHPITSEEAPERAQHQEFYRDQCLDCHEDYATYPYGFFYGDIPEYYFEYPRWGYYYAYPWWWDNYWYEEDDPETFGGDGQATPSAKSTRRGGLVPPYVGGSSAVTTGFGGARTGSSTAPSKSNTSTSTESASPGTVGEKRRVRKANGNSNNRPANQPKRTKKSSRRGGIEP